MAITSAPSDYAGLFHALRATGAAKSVPRGLPPLASPPGTAPNPWLLWFIVGILLGVLLFPREPWIERLGHALSLGMGSVVLGGAWRTLRWLLRRRYDAASWKAVGLWPQCAFGPSVPLAPVCLWPRPRLAALCPAERGAPPPAVRPRVARGRTRAWGAGHAPGARPPHSRGERPRRWPGAPAPHAPPSARHHGRPAAAAPVWPLAGAVHGELDRPRPWGGPGRRVPGRAGAPGRSAEYRHL